MLNRVVGLGATALFVAGCPSEPFGCENDGQCQVDAAAGMCEFNGYCSFPDPDCPSGRRYSNLAGGGLGGLCVNAPEETTGAGSSTGPGTTSSSPMTGLTTALTTGPSESSSSGEPGDGSSSSSETSSTGPADESSSGTTGGPDLDDGLVVYISFDDIITDDEGNVPVPAGTLPAACDLIGGTCPEFIEAGVIGMAGAFDGVDDVIAVNDDERLHLGDRFALSLWARRTGPFDPPAVIAGKAYGDGDLNSYEIYIDNPDDQAMAHRVLFNTDSPTVSAAATQTVSVEWTHVAGVREDDMWRLYVDGSLVEVEVANGDITYDDRPFLIGGDTALGELDHFFPGEIDEVRLYDRALSPNEVMELATTR